MKNKFLKISGSFLLSCMLLNPVMADFREHFDLGQGYLAQYQYSGAISEFKAALRINYMDTSARIGLINAYLARSAEYANKDKAWGKAADDCRSALFYLVYYPNQSAVQNSAQAISQVKNNLERCLNELKFSRDPQNRYETAKKLRAEGNFSAAAYEFTQALGDKKLQKDCFEQIGDIMNILGNKPKAEEYYKRAVAVSPQDLNLRLTYAKILDANEKDEDATREYSYVLERSKSSDKDNLYILERTFIKKLSANPKDANLNVNMGAVLQKEGRLDEALSYYKQAENLDPSNINTRINVGTLYQQKEDYRTAIKAYESVLILYPDNVNALLYRAQCFDKLGDSRIAQEGYKKVMALDPNNDLLKHQMLENVKKASSPSEFVDYVKVNFGQNNPETMIYDYAIELHKDNKIADSLYLYTEAIKAYGDKAPSELYVNMALAQAQDKQYEQAIKTLNSAAARFPNDASVKEQLKNLSAMRTDSIIAEASKYFEKKDYKKAIDSYLKINPATVDSMLGVAASYQAINDIDNAIEYYKKALELKPIDSDIAYYIATLYGEKEDFENAKIYLQKSVTFNKNNADAVAYLKSINDAEVSNLLNDAISKYEANNYEEGLLEFNQVLKNDPNNSYALYYRGMIYDSQEKRKEAISDLSRAYDLNKDFSICNYMIATNYDSLGNTSEAYKYYSAYAQSDVPDDDYKKYAQARAEELKENANKTPQKK